MTTTRNAENLSQEKSRYSLIVERMLALALSTKLVEKIRICLKISNELHNAVLHCG